MNSARRFGCSVLLFLLTPAWHAAVAEKPAFELGKAVPADVCFYVHAVHNPEQDFLTKHWAEVWEAFEQSGFREALLDLIRTQLDQQDLETFDEFVSKATKLIKDVEWTKLAGKEFVYSFRFRSLVPDYILLFRGDGESVDKNFEGLRAIMGELAGLSEQACLNEETLAGTTLYTLSVTNEPFAICLFNRGDIIGITMGRRGAEDVLCLLSGKKKDSICDAPRFRKALKTMPPPEDMVLFCDMQGIIKGVRHTIEFAVDAKQPSLDGADASAGKDCPGRVDEERIIRRVVEKLLDAASWLDYIIVTGDTDGLRYTEHTRVVVAKDANDKVCFRAATKNQPFKTFDKYIPKEATSCSVWSGMDFEILYKEILKFVGEEIPDGKEGLATWADIQEEHGFNVERDFFSWFEGRFISVSLPATGFSALGGGSDWVHMVSVKDDKLAAEKVDTFVNWLNGFLAAAQQTLTIEPVTGIKGGTFKSVSHPFLAMLIKPVYGVADGWLIVGSSESTISKCLATAAGKHPSFRKNARFQAEGILPEGPVHYFSFEDTSNRGKDCSTICGAFGMAGNFIPNEPETKLLRAILRLLTRLGPVAAELDFFKSSSHISVYEDMAWIETTVTNYKPYVPKVEVSPELQMTDDEFDFDDDFDFDEEED